MNKKIIYINNVKTNYYIYDNGDIYNYKTKRFLKGTVFGTGYRFVSLSVNNRNKNYSVHRLVANAFIPNPNNYSIVNHIDGNKLNNIVSNLEWCNAAQNTQHAYANGLANGKRHKWNRVNIDKDELAKNWRQYRDTTYYISKKGDIYNTKNNVLGNKTKKSDGYESFSICVNGKSKHKLVHCLVASAWLDYDETSGYVINHKDGNKINNNVNNLEIVTKKDNSLHSCYTLGNCTKKVVRYKEGEEDVIYPSLTVCAKENNVCVSAISLAIRDHSKSNKGHYYYKFLNEA